jgi:frataxin-like iron-binding protein CyaY
MIKNIPFYLKNLLFKTKQSNSIYFLSITSFHRQISSNPNESVINKKKIKLEDDEDIDDIDINLDNIVETKPNNTLNQSSTQIEPKEISLDAFMNHSLRYFEKIHKAFQNLKEYEDIKIETDKNSFFLRVTMKQIGTWIFVRELDTKNVTFTSPISGFFKYKYDPTSNYWISLKDGHILDDLVIREFCKVSKGLLYFD